MRGGRFRIEFQPGQWNLTHTYGNQVTHTTFPLSFQSVDPGHPPRLQSPTSLYPYVATKIKPTSTRRVKGRSTRRSNQVLNLTDYYISRHMASTFKRLTKWGTHRDLSHFWLHQRGITTTQPRRCPYISAGIKGSQNSYLLARGRKPLDFYRT